MVFEIWFTFLLITTPVISGLKLEVDGKMDFGPEWNYEYRIKPVEGDTEGPSRTHTSIDGQQISENNVKNQSRYVDLIIKSNKDNPRLLQVAEARSYDQNIMRDNIANQTNTNIKSDVVQVVKKDEPLKFSDEHTEPNTGNDPTSKRTEKSTSTDLVKVAKKSKKTPKPKKSDEMSQSEEDSSNEYSEKVTVLMPLRRKKGRRVKIIKTDILTQDVKLEKTKDLNSMYLTQNSSKQENAIRAATTTNAPITLKEESIEKEIFIKSHYVKDNPRIKEFTRHIYEQSIKTLESFKDKVNNYEIRNKIDHMMRSYEERFGDFVRDTQNQRIRTRLGEQKVILNTLDTSNRILDRLVNYMIGKMDQKGILRNAGTENVILMELKKKKDLENIHLCYKMQICPSNDGFTKFTVDILSTILSSPDKKIIEIRDALTEVLKNTDFSNFLEPATEKRFLRGIGNIERYNAETMRPIFFMMKNILASKNGPIKVIGPPDGRVNKTLAFIEMLDTWEKKLPPNEQNLLEWNDMRNSFNEWKTGKRKDTVELFQHLTDHIVRTIDDKNGRMFNKNINTMLGY